MDAQTIENVNTMPAPTWGWLKMNGTKVEVPNGLRFAPQAARLELDGFQLGDRGAFERALEDSAPRFRHLRRASAPGDASAQAQAAAGELDTLDVPAVSTYQQGAVAVEENYSPALAFETGMGEGAFAYLRKAAGPTITLIAMPRSEAKATIRVTGTEGTASVAATDFVVADHATVDIVISLETQEVAGEAADGAIAGIAGSSLRVFAGAHSRVNVTCVQTAGSRFIALDDSGFFLDDDARVTVSHAVLGAGGSYTGLAGDLAGEAARIEVKTSYLGTGSQQRDFNYELRHRGRRTASNLNANGVLAGSSSKILRSTIDLVHGCKGSEGSERETVLIADERAKNKTVPVILCDEDDVAGNHGATIGHVRPDQLFYLASRGVSPEEAEVLFIRAKLEDAALNAPDEATRAAVLRCADTLIDGFSEEFADDFADLEEVDAA